MKKSLIGQIMPLWNFEPRVHTDNGARFRGLRASMSLDPVEPANGSARYRDHNDDHHFGQSFAGHARLQRRAMPEGMRTGAIMMAPDTYDAMIQAISIDA